MIRDSHSVEPSEDDSRYQFERKLGEGSNGSVYLVRDRETGERLALKRLHRVDDRSVARLKREFRSLTNINHRNVIKLYDLGRSQDAWFLTMEYLDGAELLHYFDALDISTTVKTKASKPHADVTSVGRLASAFQQLASGVSALHQAGVLHRDLKPSNVIVAQDRVVVVDFGLALELGEQAMTVTMDGMVAGTPAYMAPEQYLGRDWGEPNDWYAFGVMLYEALSGSLPIGGRMQELLRRKLDSDPRPLDELVSGVPPALSALCMRLLHRQPEFRPTAEEILTVLHACSTVSESVRSREQSKAPAFTTTRQRLSDPWIFGREEERERLSAALAKVEAGGFAAVHVCGPSGAGKSILVESYLDDLAERAPGAANQRLLILRSRCYEREQVPFKALDAAMDALVTQLSREDDLEVSHVLPSDIQILTQLFPALTRLNAVQRLVDPKLPVNAARQTRDRAESALRHLFERLGSRWSVVLWIDDLHWGDLDSGRILKSWMDSAALRGVLLILSYRSDEVSTSPCLRLLAEPPSALKPEDIVAIGPLADEHIRALCRQRFAASVPPREVITEIADHIVSEARGSPFLASQLAALALSEMGGSGPDALEILTIDELVSRRTALLSQAARRLLHVLSAASRPLPRRMALQLAAASQEARAAQHELARLGLIRTRDGDGERLLEVYHDRLRAAVLAHMSATEHALLDRELLHMLETEGSSDVAWMHTLALGSGDRAAALRYGLAAADRAFGALAFEFAAELYRTCLGLKVSEPRELGALWQKLAAALAHSGHGHQAANAYLEAAERAEGFEALQLKRRAASHLLRSGRFEAGEALIREVLKGLHIDVPTSTAGLLAAIGWERTRAAVRGLRFTPRDRESTPLEVRYAGEVCATLSIETQIYAPLRAALLQARSLRGALDCGAPDLIARALCVAATMTAVSGGERGAQRAEELLTRATEIAKPLDSAMIDSNINSAHTVCAFLQNRMDAVIEYSGAFERSYRAANSDNEGEYHHRFTVVAARTTALLILGQHRQGEDELRDALSEARKTENINALLTLSALQTRVEIATDQDHDTKARLEREREQLPREHFGLLHVYHLTSLLRLGCATGDYAWTLRVMQDDWERFQRSLFKRVGAFAVIVPAIHARFILNHGVSLRLSPAELTKRVSRNLHTLSGFKAAAARGAILRTRARLAYLEGDRSTAISLLQQSAALFDSPVSADEAARDRYAYGTLLGGDAGAALQSSAIDELRNHGIVSPLRDLASYYPELFAAR